MRDDPRPPPAIGGRRHETPLANAEAERDRYQLLLDINNAVVTQLGLANVLHGTCQALRKVIRHDAASITLHDAVTGELRLHSFDLQYASDLEEGALFPLEGSPQGVAFTSRRPVLITKLDLNGLCTSPVQNHNNSELLHNNGLPAQDPGLRRILYLTPLDAVQSPATEIVTTKALDN